jgi:hypothetical protein
MSSCAHCALGIGDLSRSNGIVVPITTGGECDMNNEVMSDASGLFDKLTSVCLMEWAMNTVCSAVG